MIVSTGLGAYTWEAPYGYNADGTKIAPYGSDIYGRPRTGIPGIPESNPDPNYVPEEDFTAGQPVLRKLAIALVTGRVPEKQRITLTTEVPALQQQAQPSTSQVLSGTNVPGVVSGFDLSSFRSEMISGTTLPAIVSGFSLSPLLLPRTSGC